MKIDLYSLVSPLHAERLSDPETDRWLDELEQASGCCVVRHGTDFSGYGEVPFPLLHVRSGGTEGLFLKEYRRIGPNVRLLASGTHNSLAAALEIADFVRNQGGRAEILHGALPVLAERLARCVRVAEAAECLRGKRAAAVGEPSDWLISSAVSPRKLREKLGLELLSLPMQHCLELVEMQRGETPYPRCTEWVREAEARLGEAAALPAMQDALRIYAALKYLMHSRDLSGITLRCFDLLQPLRNTGCLALALLNAEGLTAACEGDVPALLSMMLMRGLTGTSGFQANPSGADTQRNELVLAHCTVPLDLLPDYRFDTHFESGLGVAVRGVWDPGAVTLFKLGASLAEFSVFEGTSVPHRWSDSCCRTQIRVRLDEPLEDFLQSPGANHRIVVPGRHKEEIEALMRELGIFC